MNLQLDNIPVLVDQNNHCSADSREQVQPLASIRRRLATQALKSPACNNQQYYEQDAFPITHKQISLSIAFVTVGIQGRAVAEAPTGVARALLCIVKGSPSFLFIHHLRHSTISFISYNTRRILTQPAELITGTTSTQKMADEGQQRRPARAESTKPGSSQDTDKKSILDLEAPTGPSLGVPNMGIRGDGDKMNIPVCHSHDASDPV